MPAVDSATATIWVSRLAHCRDHELAFPVEIIAHVVEFLDHGLDPLPETHAREVTIDLLRLGLLTLMGPESHRLRRGFAGERRERECAPRVGHPYAVHQIEPIDVLGQRQGHDECDVGAAAALIIPQFRKPSVAPGLRPLYLQRTVPTVRPMSHLLSQIRAEFPLADGPPRHRLKAADEQESSPVLPVHR